MARWLGSAGLSVLVLAVAASCTQIGKPANAPPRQVKPQETAPHVSKAIQPECSLAWQAHGHTTQQKAKQFAKTCLKAEDGAVDLKMSAAAIRGKLETLIPPSHRLTSIVPSDIDAFCPGYASAGEKGRAQFWQTLITAVAKPESAYSTKTAYWEAGQHQYSLGLLQLSYNDKLSYRNDSIPGCDFRTEAEVTDPDLNLQCGVKIFTELVARSRALGGDGARPRGGAAAYWSTLRAGQARTEIVAATKNLPVCH